MARAIDSDAIVQLVLDDDRRRRHLAAATALDQPVDLRLRSWEVWLRDGGRPGTSSYVGPLEPCRVAGANTALRAAATHESPGRSAQLDRAALAALSVAAGRSNERRCIALWVATMMWGGGTLDTRAPWHTAQGLADPELGAVLTSSHREVRAGRLAEAYRIAAAIPGTGAAAVTRWLWAASLGVPPADRQPLVLDHDVRRTLGRAEVRPERSGQGYAAYVDAMHEAAATLRTEHRLRCAEPERLQRSLALQPA